MKTVSRYYSMEKIKEIFAPYKTKSSLSLNDYDIFCQEIRFLPRELVNKVENEIEFSFLSSQPTDMNPACYVSISTLPKGKKGVIFLSPFLFSIYFDKEYRKIRCDESAIIHEIAHHILGHTVQSDQNEREADAQATRWIDEYFAANRDADERTPGDKEDNG